MMQDRKICILGSTGSVGTQAIQVIRRFGFKLDAIAAGSDIMTLEEQIREFSPALCAVCDEKAAAELKLRVADTSTRVIGGADAAETVAFESSADTVVNSIMGSKGILPTVAAINSKKDIAMANKEPIVAAGEVILALAREKGVRILPVDSEHSAIFQCLSGAFNSHGYIKRLILTASGGPFYGKTRDELTNITPAQATDHPVWKMGKKISVDSATLMNKGLELIEAVRLFDVEAQNVDITVHRQSIVHSMVEFVDGAVMAQMGKPDMRHCIQFALCYPKRCEGLCESLDFTKLFELSFAPVDEETFTLIGLAREAAARGGVYPAVMNAANEAAVDLFLREKIAFLDIFSLVKTALFAKEYHNLNKVEEILELDAKVKEYVYTLAGTNNNI